MLHVFGINSFRKYTMPPFYKILCEQMYMNFNVTVNFLVQTLYADCRLHFKDYQNEIFHINRVSENFS